MVRHLHRRVQGDLPFRNPDNEVRELRVAFPLPAENALFDDFVFAIDGRPALQLVDAAKEMTASTTAAPGAVVTLDVRYKSRGLGTWTYAFADQRRRAGPRFQPGAAHQLPGHRLPRRLDVADDEDARPDRLGAQVDVHKPAFRARPSA